MKKIQLIILDILFLVFVWFILLRTQAVREQAVEDDYIARVENISPKALFDEEKLSDSPFTQFAEQKFPELGARWQEVRAEYNKTLQAIHLLESKRADLLVVATWEGSQIDLHSGLPYLTILNRLIRKCNLLKEQHEKLLPTMQRYYAENAVREIIGDNAIQDDIDELLKTTDDILKITSDKM